jgi:hypothetical protein
MAHGLSQLWVSAPVAQVQVALHSDLRLACDWPASGLRVACVLSRFGLLTYCNFTEDDLYRSPNTVRVIKWRRMRWAGM